MEPGLIGEIIGALGAPGAVAILLWRVFQGFQKSWNENNEKMALANERHTQAIIDANKEQNAIAREDQRLRDEQIRADKEAARADTRALIEESKQYREEYIRSREQLNEHFVAIVRQHEDYKQRTEALVPAALAVRVGPGRREG